MNQSIVVPLILLAVFSAMFGYIVGHDDRVRHESTQTSKVKYMSFTVH
jgi:hypothetical protein